jgi:hypothetical protein
MNLSPTHPDAVRRLERLADRLRVVGPRLAARDGVQAHDLLQAIREGLQELADLTADVDGRPRRPVPELAGFALADQALVLGHDLLGKSALSKSTLGKSTLGEDTLGEDAMTERSDAFRAIAVQAIERIQRLI